MLRVHKTQKYFKLYQKCISSFFIFLCLTGCTTSYEYGADLTPATKDSVAYTELTQELQTTLAQTPHRYKIVYVSDRLNPTFAMQPGAQNSVVMHTYMPYDFVGGPKGYARTILEKALQTERATTDVKKVYFVGIDLKEFDARILHGNLKSGNLGRYYGHIVARIRVTDHKGEVLIDQDFGAKQYNIRQGFSGRHLNVAQDEANMRSTLNTVLHHIVKQFVDQL